MEYRSPLAAVILMKKLAAPSRPRPCAFFHRGPGGISSVTYTFLVTLMEKGAMLICVACGNGQFCL